MGLRRDVFEICTKFRHAHSKYFACPRIGDVIQAGVMKGAVLRETQRVGKGKLKKIMQ